MMFDLLGDPANAAIARAAVEKLLVIGEQEAYCQPCVSPVWDTALNCHAFLEMGGTMRTPPPPAASTGSFRAKCSMSWATGRRGDPTCGRAAGPSNMPIRTIPISTIPR